MCVDISHLVLEALGDTDDQVVDEGSDCAEGSDVLSGTVVQFDVDNILLWVGEVDGQVVEVLRELACIPPLDLPCPSQVIPVSVRTSWTLNSNKSGLDGDLDYSHTNSSVVALFPMRQPQFSPNLEFRAAL